MADTNRHLWLTLIALLLSIGVAPAAGAAPKVDNPGNNQNAPWNDILTQLEELKTDISDLRDDVAAVQREVITCTLRAKRAGLCDRVREAKASACFELDVLEAKLLARWIAEVKAKVEGGAGWTSGPDAKIVAEGKTPIGPVPSNFGLEIAPKLGVKSELCVEFPLEVFPASGSGTGRTFAASGITATSESDLEALATRFEEISATVVPLVVERVDSRMPTGDRIAAGVMAFDRLGDGDLTFLGGDLLSDPMLLELTNIMPTPAILRTAIQNPGALSDRMPPLNGTVRQRVATLCNPQTGLPVVRSPLFSGAAGQVCGHLNTVPDFDGIAGQLLDIPEATAALVDGLIDKTQQITTNTANWFCSKPLFAGTKLCR